MKIILYSFIVFFLTCLPAKADWTQNFTSIHAEQGVDPAVLSALGEGVAPVNIIAHGITIEDLQQPELIKALFCALVLPDTINEAAEANRVTESTVAEGYQLALAQCADEMEEQANVAPNAAFPGTPPAGQERTGQASPWNFN